MHFIERDKEFILDYLDEYDYNPNNVSNDEFVINVLCFYSLFNEENYIENGDYPIEAWLEHEDLNKFDRIYSVFESSYCE